MLYYQWFLRVFCLFLQLEAENAYHTFSRIPTILSLPALFTDLQSIKASPGIGWYQRVRRVASRLQC